MRNHADVFRPLYTATLISLDICAQSRSKAVASTYTATAADVIVVVDSAASVVIKQDSYVL